MWVGNTVLLAALVRRVHRVPKGIQVLLVHSGGKVDSHSVACDWNRQDGWSDVLLRVVTKQRKGRLDLLDDVLHVGRVLNVTNEVVRRASDVALLRRLAKVEINSMAGKTQQRNQQLCQRQRAM